MSLPFDPVDKARENWVERGWESAAEGMAAVTSIMRAQQIVLSRVDTVLRPLGLTFARYELLMLLEFSQNGSLPMGVIGSRLQVHPTSVTNAVDRLEQSGLVSRHQHRQDRRAVIVKIEVSGIAAATAATELLNKQVFSDIGIDDGLTHSLVAILRDLRESAGDF
jgi:DNA-binding MarR family transcriptional regulator